MTEVKTRGYLSDDCLSLQLYKARNATSNSSASVFGQLAWEVKTATRSQNCIWPGWLFSVLKTQTQSSSALGEEVKGEEKKKLNLQPLFFLHDNQWHLTGGICNLLLFCCTLAQPTRAVFLSSFATESALKETPQELSLLWETPRTQFNLIISWNKSSCVNFYDPMHF